jgi:hypothetical protein
LTVGQEGRPVERDTARMAAFIGDPRRKVAAVFDTPAIAWYRPP